MNPHAVEHTFRPYDLRDIGQEIDEHERWALEIQDQADRLRPNRGRNRELTALEELQIERLTDSQLGYSDAFCRVVGCLPEVFYGDPRFTFEDDIQRSLAEQILLAHNARDTEGIRRILVGRSIELNTDGERQIEQKGLEELLRLLEYKRASLR